MGDALIIGALSPGIRKAQRNALDAYFPFVGGPFPFNERAADVVVNADVTWDDDCGYKQVGKLTIAAGKVITIDRSPFCVFADEIIFGGVDSIISANGPSGGPTAYPDCWARGGTIESGDARAQGGCGGGTLVIVCNKISGAPGLIRANGGDGYANGTNAAVINYAGGQGAFSNTLVVGGAGSQEKWAGGLTGFLANGGRSETDTYGGTGGGSGGFRGGGSGWGGGGTTSNNPLDQGKPSIARIPLWAFLQLALWGCLGGGGGASFVHTAGANNSGSGGGGGGIGLITKDVAVTPTLEANGGTNAGGNGNPGGAGFTAIWEV